MRFQHLDCAFKIKAHMYRTWLFVSILTRTRSVPLWLYVDFGEDPAISLSSSAVVGAAVGLVGLWVGANVCPVFVGLLVVGLPVGTLVGRLVGRPVGLVVGTAGLAVGLAGIPGAAVGTPFWVVEAAADMEF